jgi:hypothetical protein
LGYVSIVSFFQCVIIILRWPPRVSSLIHLRKEGHGDLIDEPFNPRVPAEKHNEAETGDTG